ncbi:MAG TPA: S46 family peptidase [Candidatus Saccharimonadales bacterium]|nr:S46 family peptidase [Candidatus Saccharimonadales bacterium]
MKRRILALVALLCSLAVFSAADEGMWLFNKAPKDQIKKDHNFTVTQPWLDHLRLGSVRFNNGGSGSFVSEDGLAFTNHHVGRVCLQQLSTEKKDYIKDGFYARTQADEGKCPDLELNVLVDIQDVTADVQGAATSGMTDAEGAQAQRQKMSAIEKECSEKSGLRCDIVTLYAGGMYNLYKYKKYTDVRVVFAPEAQMAFFGGDHDNFEYPRYDLDITYFRVYENNKPVHLTNYLKWSATGTKAGDLVFVSGHPGGTERLLTMAELNYLKDVQTAYVIDLLTRRDKVLHDFAAKSAENARVAGDDIFGVENSLKAYKGRRGGLEDKELMDKKAADEQKLRAAVNADPKLKAAYGTAWDEVAKAVEVRKQLFFPYTFIERAGGFNAQMTQFARVLVRVTAEKQKPNPQRLREFSEARLPSLEQQLFSTAPVYRTLDVATLTESLTLMQEKLGADDPTVKRALNGKTPAEAAQAYIDGSKLDDPALRKQLYQGGAEAVAACTDPLIVLMRDIDPRAREIRKQWDDKVDAVVRQNSTRIAKARFAVQGANSYPDATFTLRLSYGTIKGYQENGKQIAPYTNIGGAFEHATANGNKGDFELPKTWDAAKSKLDLKTPLNFVHTSDIIGGNSGSPTVDKKGEVVGIIFDGNIQSLPWDFAYDDREGRAVSVDSRAILESIRKIYNANPLADELVSGHQPKAAAAK